ncbi:MAG: hypothetical protein JJ863_07290 [Deltaproteobacteria bacterium]|nr:hypothetical protein [Deltaproteobacteria bacterium]
MRSALLLALAFTLACGGNDSEEVVATTGTGGEDTRPASFDWGKPMGDDLRVGGQPSEADLEAAAAAGVRTVISLRPEGEAGSEGERETVDRLGMTFVSIPVAGAADLTEANATALDEALQSSGSTILHCGSGNRAGSLLGLRAYVTGGATGDEAMSLATDAGMTHLSDALRAKLTELCQSAPDRCPSE